MSVTESAKRRRIKSPLVSEPAEKLWSNCYEVGDFIILTGMTSRTDDWGLSGIGDPYQQAIDCFRRMKHLLEAANATMNDVIKLTVFLSDIRHRDAFVRARQEFFSGDFPPCVVVGNVALASPDVLVEFDGWAIRGSGG